MSTKDGDVGQNGNGHRNDGKSKGRGHGYRQKKFGHEKDHDGVKVGSTDDKNGSHRHHHGNRYNSKKSYKPHAKGKVLTNTGRDVWKRGVTKDENDSMLQEVRDILNKLAPEKEGILIERFKRIPIPDSNSLGGVINLIFEKALLEPAFCAAYTRLCKSASETKGFQVMDNIGDAKIFKRMLLDKCQGEFNRCTKMSFPGAQQQEQRRSPLEWEQMEYDTRKKMTNLMIFVGELFIGDLLSDRVMTSVVESLLLMKTKEIPPAMYIESVCKLLTVIGEKYETPTENRMENLNGYFERIESLSSHQSLSARYRFMLRDLCELRDNRWTSRRKQEKPKTIEEVKSEVEREKLERGIESCRSK